MKLQVYIPERMNKDLRNFIALKYQTFEKGLLSAEVEQAIGHWLALHTNTQEYPTDAPNPLPKISKHYRAFKNWLLTSYYQELPPGAVIPTQHFQRAIMNTRGSDPRTIKKWMRIFVENGLVKNLGPNSWELIA